MGQLEGWLWALLGIVVALGAAMGYAVSFWGRRTNYAAKDRQAKASRDHKEEDE